MNQAEEFRQKKSAEKAARDETPGKASPQAGQNSLELAYRHHAAGRLPEAEGIYREILRTDPNQPVALHLLGVIAHQAGHHAAAVELIAKSIALKPDYAEAYVNLGLARHNSGQPDEAVESYRKALSLQPNAAVTHSNLGNALKDLGRLEEATASYKKALAIQPAYPEANVNLGLVLQDLGELDEAVDSYAKALAIKPDFAEAHYNLGNALQELERLDEAVASYARALEFKSDYAEAHSNLGNALRGLGKLDQAVASYAKALAINPRLAETHGNLGNALKSLGRPDEAVASYNKALEIGPDNAEAHVNLGLVLQEQGMLDAAVASYGRALALKPDLAEAHHSLGNGLQELGRLEEAVVSYRKALAVKPDYPEAHSNLIFSMSYIPDITSEDLLQEARRWGARYGFRGETPKLMNPIEPDRKLRIGLVSGDLRYHSVAKFLETILLEIDPEKLDIVAYSTSGDEDAMTARLKEIVAEWRTMAGVGDQRMAADIIADGIDILVDLSGHTTDHRLSVFSRKPAPIQVTWLGYGGTTGVEAVDFILCDDLVLPACDEAQFTEKPWRLPDIWVCFSPPGLDIEVGAPPALANGHITFGCFNNLTKVSDKAVACWARVLEAVPDSRLLLKAKQLKDPTVRKKTRSRFGARGIDPSRLTLKSPSPGLAEHLRTYNEMDIALDPFPYAGGATSIEAFWMGTPVLTMKGDRFVSHMGESIVQNAGLGTWIADTPEDYVAKAAAFASDLAALSATRKGLRRRLLESPICDAPRFARNLEEAFRGMWREHCKKTG